MKRTTVTRFLIAWAIAGAMPAFAQNNTPGANGTNFTIVTIHATDTGASEAGHTGRFLVSRGTRTNGDLMVWLQLGGTALNGTDYQALTNIVVIPNGAQSAELTVVPIDDSLPEPTESVVARVISSPLASPVILYYVGSPNSATVTIADNDLVQSNRPPAVAMTQPQTGSTFPEGSNIGLVAEAHDADGSVAAVEFFANDHSLGLGARGGNSANGVISSNLWYLSWRSVPAGAYTVTAKATDNQGAMGTSPGILVLVGTHTPPAPTNTEPVIVNIVATDPHASEGLVMWCSNTVVGVNGPAANDGWRTNCPNVLGTNTATFTVRRSGPTNHSLRVYYAIGGTASNGVDYAPLSGLVTIAAGRRSAEIVVFPVDDTVPEHIETVLLKLHLPPLPLDPADAPYTLGRPESAAAFIVDNDTPPPPPRVLPDGMFHACEHLSNGCFRVEFSTNLLHWDIICTNAVADGMARHVDPDAGNHLHRFYRITPIPCPPAEP